MTYVVIGIRCLIGMLFVVSAASKLRGPDAFGAFADSLRRLGFVSPAILRPVAIAAVLAEVAIPVLLALPMARAQALGFALAAVLLAVLATGIALGLRRGARVACRCFGHSEEVLGRRHVARNGGLAVVATLGLVGALVTPAGPVLAEPAIVAGLAGLATALIVTRFDDLLELFSVKPSQT
ncbi:MAG TPA: MauE/DoxX family redox-associated membrane protein [Actinophytocola sp.]|uniref:MauE/DoxX family redox-associated membrane protein n=1 Tax=Actinophytocola sp. TaxID=1872138 RepID=UPI002DBD2FB3|nr:MauE/DoxX family redox-associated membrane protein [Actinophytocola sp.]HEU5471042.1 MauE/DoxX family redox-associated membrane protein [Actinophytocola sp.]